MQPTNDVIVGDVINDDGFDVACSSAGRRDIAAKPKPQQYVCTNMNINNQKKLHWISRSS